MNMNSILVVTAVLLYCLTRVESYEPVACPDLSNYTHFRGVNIVLKGTVSHTPPDTFDDDKYNATLAADGNCDTYLISSPPTCSITANNYRISPTWTVTLDKSYQITGIVIYNREDFRHHLGNFTVFGACGGAEKVVLYDDAKLNKYQLEVIQLKINDSHECSSISIQIPPKPVDVRSRRLILCEVQVYAAVCSKPTNPFIIDMNRNKSFYNTDESLNFECKPGYRPSPSNRTVTCCGVDTFCPSPDCERVYCQLPTQPDNGKYLPTSTNTSSEYGTTIIGVCDTGYKPELSDTRRTCQQNGTWSGQDLVCTQIICNPPPVIQNGYYTGKTAPFYYNDQMTPTCSVGYSLSNNATRRTCQQNGTWSGPDLVCTQIICNPPPIIQNGYYIGKTAPFYYNDRMTPTCYVGYSLSNNDTIVCAENGWVNSTAMCVTSSSSVSKETEGLFSTEMFVGTLLGAVLFIAIITTTIVCVVIKRLCRRADTMPNNLYGDLALRNTSNEGAYSDLQGAIGN